MNYDKEWESIIYTLDLSVNTDISNELLSTYLECNTKSIVVDVSGCVHLNNSSLLKIVRTCNRLEVLNMCLNSQVKMEDHLHPYLIENINVSNLKKLNLRNRSGINPRLLIKIIRSCRISLQSLDISGCDIDMKTLLKIIHTCQNLQEIYINKLNCDLRDLILLLRNNISLKVLDNQCNEHRSIIRRIMGCKKSDLSVDECITEYFCDIIPGFLTQLNLRYHDDIILNNSSFGKLFSSKSLSVLHLSVEFSGILYVVSSNINNLTIDSHNITNDIFLTIIASCPSLQFLKLINCKNINENILLSLMNCKDLKELYLEDYHKLTDNAISVLTNLCDVIEHRE